MTPRHRPASDTGRARRQHGDDYRQEPTGAEPLSIPTPFTDVVQWAEYACQYGDCSPLTAALLQEVLQLRERLTAGGQDTERTALPRHTQG